MRQRIVGRRLVSLDAHILMLEWSSSIDRKVTQFEMILPTAL